MLVSTVLTTGQITLIVRVIIQVLSSGGLFLIGLIILGNAPRIASISTHDVLNRIAGKQTTTLASVKWLFTRRKTNDPTNTSRVTLGIALLISYTFFIKITDFGLIGLQACRTAGSAYLDNPASVRTDEESLALVNSNVIKGSDLAAINYLRCDSSQPFEVGRDQSRYNGTYYGCTSWKNSTYADKQIFEGLNLSDTAVLMPRQLTRYHYHLLEGFELNSYFMGPLTRRIKKPTIMNGILVYPHETGFRAFLGAPDLPPFTHTSLPQTLALEVDIGCMSIGMYSREDMSTSFPISKAENVFDIGSDTWRKYAGPEYLRDVLSQTVDEIRNYSAPMWNMSTLDDRGMVHSGRPTVSLSMVASVQSLLDYVDLLANCTARMDKHLNLTDALSDIQYGPSCGLLTLGGSSMEDGVLIAVMSRMVCATAVHVNLVRADISVDGNGEIDLSFGRLPSDLNVVVADYWQDFAQKVFTTDRWDQTYRYTLAPNPNGQAIHYINARHSRGIGFAQGPGSGANSFASVAGIMLKAGGVMDGNRQFSGLALLDNVNITDLQPSHVTKWAGEIGASYILGSTSFNGWAATSLQPGPLTVTSTGGKAAACYNLVYALAFVPLLLTVIVIIFLSLEMLISSTLLKGRKMEHLYGGLEPYASVICPDKSPTDTLLAWEIYGQPRLEPVQNGQTIEVGGDGIAMECLHLGNNSGKE